MRRSLPMLLLLLAAIAPCRAASTGGGQRADAEATPFLTLRLGNPHARGPLATWRSVLPVRVIPETDGRILFFPDASLPDLETFPRSTRPPEFFPPSGPFRSRHAFGSPDTVIGLPPDLHGPTEGPVHPTRLWLMGGTMLAANAAIVAYFFDTYYNDDFAKTAPFHTFNDWYNADLNVDKLGHIWSAQAYAQATYHMFRWANMSQWNAMYWSSGLAFLYQLEMEITDGLFEKWGFSWWDVAANTIGAVWPNLQRIYPSLRPVMIKMSYHPSASVKRGWVEHDYLRDYDGFTYWLALSVEDVLPSAVKPYWPDWLGVAVGYGANRTMLGDGIYNSRNGVGQGEQEWYIALDYDLRKLPGDSKFLLWLKESFNIFHLPAPAVRITPSAVYYGLYF